MSLDAISGVQSSAVSSNQKNNSTALTDATKKQLESMGIDTSNVKTESEGKTKLQEAQASQQQQQAQAAQAKGSNSSEQEMKTEVTDLASQMDVEVQNDDSTSTILDNISQKLEELQAAAGTDPSKVQEYQSFESQYNTLNQEYTQSQSSQSMLSSSLSGMANYNKALLGLAA